MIVLDANVLLYAHDADSPHHRQTRAWLEKAASGRELLGLTWFTIAAFLRISTNGRLYPSPLSAGEAGSVISTLLRHPAFRLIEPGESFWDILLELLEEARVSGPLVTDAILAAIALERGATLASSDRDFRRFKGLRLIDPLQL
ncbi:MAG: type II toxin-antitoxin system VapC family toxin [Acidobacteria bacterium]|nr:type II toxin-antitoxin system VapC family toxin [Acidobacteriota bacterium]